MRVALVNPAWQFEGSIYFGCREPHLPLEFGAATVLLERANHEVLLLDGHLTGTPTTALADEAAAFEPDLTVVTTAPSYLFWRCAPPELRIPRDFLRALKRRGGRTVAVGPHGSVTPETTIRKLGVDIVVRGECEEALVDIAEGGELATIPGLAFLQGADMCVVDGPRAATFVNLPAIVWPEDWIRCHHHHHHRFDAAPDGPGAEVESSRGCPYSCSFCAKTDYRDKYRGRALDALLEELDGLTTQGITYIYFIDEIFLPQKALLEALAARRIPFGLQTRIDLWKHDALDLLGEAGCV
jgi:anaerobic magnesium-protoporphyrin IX monomethyl ester cyclase